MKKILVISNGYGEDLIAKYLIKAIKKELPICKIKVLPLVGQGLTYIDDKIKPLARQDVLPSGGFIRSLSALMHDLLNGLLKQTLKNILILKRISNKFDVIIAVGDVYCLLLSSLFNHKVRFFLPTAKSDYFMPHSRLECFIIKRLTKKVFPRDELTAASLRKADINAQFLGNIMFEAIDFSDTNYKFTEKDYVFGLLPGSRKEAFLNINKLCELACELSTNQKNAKFILAKANSLNLKEIEDQLSLDWELISDDNFARLHHIKNDVSIIIASKFGDVLRESDIILGLAGTANEQAVYFGHTVITFQGAGVQSTKKRFLEQKKLLGDKAIFIDKKNIPELAQEIISCSSYVARPQKLNIAFSPSEIIAKDIVCCLLF
ncbi:MAG: lipid-A-disaccharide synthase-related protein [Candidatus Margulisiibacteriota bacterium]|jgi:uncharacterized protein (TIGR03492 family)